MAYGYIKGRVEYGVAATWPYGTTVRIYGEFRNSSNVLVSPTATSLRIRTPDGVEYTVSPTEESTGIFYYETAASQTGRWVYRWSGTGTINVAGEFSFTIDQTEFPGVSGASSLPVSGDNQKILYYLNGVATPASDVRVIGAGTGITIGSGAISAPSGLTYQVAAGQRHFFRGASGISDVIIGDGVALRDANSREVVGIDFDDNGTLYVGGTNQNNPPGALNVGIWFGASGGQFTAGDASADYFAITPNLVDAQASTVRTTGQFQGSTAATGTQAAYTFQGDTDTGIFRPAANQVALSAGGGEVLRGGFGGGGVDPFITVGQGVATGEAAIDIGQSRTANGAAKIDFHGDADTFTDYGLRIIRNATASGTSQILHRGVGLMILATEDVAALQFQTSSTARWAIGGTSGNLVPGTDNTYDLGTSSTRVKDGYYANSVRVGTGTVSPQILSGQDAPESSITAPPGSLYLRTGGGSGTTLYCKITGTGNTGWHGFT